MSWFQDNKFNAVLAGITLAGTAGLVGWGLSNAKSYDAAKDQYASSLSVVSDLESSSLYPSQANATAKATALTKYRGDLSTLQTRFDKYRAGELKNMAPQVFTAQLKESEETVRKAFELSNTKLPGAFFLGFEQYTGAPPRQDATGILSYQAKAVTELLKSLAAAAPIELNNVHRPRLAEEEGKKWEAPAGAVSRALPVELSFTGSESSLREFVTSLASSSSYFYVVRSIRVTNEKIKGPATSDAKFEAAGSATGFEATFGGTSIEGSATPAGADSSRSLIQVAGSENLHVFIRIDVMQFLPAVKLPEL